MNKKNFPGEKCIRNLIFNLIAVVSAICMLTGCSNDRQPASEWEEAFANSEGADWEEILAEPIPVPEPEPTPPPEPVFEEYDINLMAVGDNLIHMGIVYTGKKQDGTYDYSFLYEGIAEFLEAAEVKIINQETILGGNELGFSGYPKFNSPTEVGDATVAAGFNVVLQASNHSADQGITGIQNCVNYWEKYPEVLMTGISIAEEPDPGVSDSEILMTEGSDLKEPVQDIPLITIDDVTFAVLNYTYGPNAETIPKSIRGNLNILCDWDENTGRLDFTTIHPDVLTDIQKAKEIADVVIVFPHWGTEYSMTPSRYQRQFAEQMTEAGADLIIGTHPHVIQPVEWIESENGNRALCYYSLGNYVSTQKKAESMLEAMAWVTFHVTEDDVYISEEKTGAIPMVCHYTSGPVRLDSVYLLEDYTAEQATFHGIRDYGGVTLALEDLQKWSREVLGDSVLSAADALEK